MDYSKVDVSQFSVESEDKNKPLAFTENKLNVFELGVSLLFYKWDTLTAAVESQWGGADSSDKRDWLAGSVAQLFEENSFLDAGDIEARILQIMEDEFTVTLEDDSALPVAIGVIQLYQDVKKGDFSKVKELKTEFEEKEKLRAEGKIKPVQVNVVANSDDEDEDDEDAWEDGPDDEQDVAVQKEPKEPEGPIIDDDGFELVQKKGKRRN